VDLGHSLAANENPGEAVALLARGQDKAVDSNTGGYARNRNDPPRFPMIEAA
jgi:hypothetical protein